MSEQFSLKCLETRTRVLHVTILQTTQQRKYRMQDRGQWCKPKCKLILKPN